MMRTRLAALAALALCLGWSGRASAGILFDNSARATSSYQGFRDEGFGTYIKSVAANVTITSISVYDNLLGSQNLRFVVFDRGSGAKVYDSGAQRFAGDAAGAFSWKRSAPLSVTLLAGHRYDIGVTADGTGYAAVGAKGTAAGGLVSSAGLRAGNSHFGGSFGSPTDTAVWGNADVALRLESPSVPDDDPERGGPGSGGPGSGGSGLTPTGTPITPDPEPPSLILLGIGVAGLVGYGLRPKRAVAP